MRVLSTGVYFELPVNCAAEAVVGNHSLHGTLDEEFRATLATLTECLGFVSTDETRKTHVGFLGLFLAADLNVTGINHHYEVTCVYMWCKNCLVLASEQIGCLYGNMAEVLVLGIDHPPLAFDLGSFSGKSLHTEFRKGGDNIGRPLSCQRRKDVFSAKRFFSSFTGTVFTRFLYKTSALLTPLS